MRSTSEPLALKFQAPVPQADQDAKHALARSINQISNTAKVTRAVMDELSVNYVSAEKYASQALMAAHQLACEGLQTEESLTYFQAISERYLGYMARILELGSQSLVRSSFSNQYDDDRSYR